MPKSHTRSSNRSHSTSHSHHKNKHSGCFNKKVGRVMHEYGSGDLHSGSGRKVYSREQAIAIGMSEARTHCR